MDQVKFYKKIIHLGPKKISKKIVKFSLEPDLTPVRTLRARTHTHTHALDVLFFLRGLGSRHHNSRNCNTKAVSLENVTICTV